MDVYLAVNLIILFAAALMPLFGGVLFARGGVVFDGYTWFIKRMGFKSSDPSNNMVYLFICYAVIMFITVLRSPDNGMSTDYLTYLSNSQYIHVYGVEAAQADNLIQIESGLAYLMYYAGFFFEGTLIAFIAVTATITLLSYFHRFRVDSPMVWFSVYSLITFGSYYVLFNGIAQATAVALSFLAMGYIYGKKWSFSSFLRYGAIIAAAALIHKTALLMLPMYFILTYRFRKTARGISLISAILLSSAALFLFLDEVVNFGIVNFFPEYQRHLLADISWLQAGSLVAMIRPVLLVAFLCINRKYIDYRNKIDIVAVNSTIIFFLINLLSLQTQVIQRFSYYFIPMALLIIPLMIKRMPRVKALVWTVVLVVIFMAFSLSSLYPMEGIHFKFIWD